MQKIKSHCAALYCALMLFPLGSAQLQAQDYQGNTTPAWLKNGGNLYVCPILSIYETPTFLPIFPTFISNPACRSRITL